MTVTGHVEQMHASRCYQASDRLTCTTCHDPHHAPQENEQRAHYRAACLACHEEAACRAPPMMRAEKNQDDCAACHMPASKVEIPHLAFTHHRIAIHPAAAVGVREDSPAAAGLEPVLDISRLPTIDKQWLLGLAYWGHHAGKDDALLPSARQQAWELLNFAARNGLRGERSLRRLPRWHWNRATPSGRRPKPSGRLLTKHSPLATACWPASSWPLFMSRRVD